MFIADREKFQMSGGRLTGEASSIGLKPGEWPNIIIVGDFAYLRHHKVEVDGTVLAYHYVTNRGAELVILND